MPIRTRYRCLTCGERFEADVLTKEEARERDRDNRPRYPIACPKCRRADVRPGWD
jgi:DNA-directed RNA polymerase subunit RPC12/RpoP